MMGESRQPTDYVWLINWVIALFENTLEQNIRQVLSAVISWVVDDVCNAPECNRESHGAENWLLTTS